jgi:hypothetical protein
MIKTNYGYEKFKSEQDWAKVIHLEGNEYFLCGGSWSSPVVNGVN